MWPKGCHLDMALTSYPPVCICQNCSADTGLFLPAQRYRRDVGSSTFPLHGAAAFPPPPLSGLVSPDVDMGVSRAQRTPGGAGFSRLLEGSASERLWTYVTDTEAINTHSEIRGERL